jgi:hypothetical protein
MTADHRAAAPKTSPPPRRACWSGALAASFPPIDARDFAALLDAIDRADTDGDSRTGAAAEEPARPSPVVFA